LANQAQKLTDIIDGIIKSFKHDNKILKHIEDVSSNQRKVLPDPMPEHETFLYSSNDPKPLLPKIRS
jgi:hypothetical protein